MTMNIKNRHVKYIVAKPWNSQIKFRPIGHICLNGILKKYPNEDQWNVNRESKHRCNCINVMVEGLLSQFLNWFVGKDFLWNMLEYEIIYALYFEGNLDYKDELKMTLV